jgi:hypothetical protein
LFVSGVLEGGLAGLSEAMVFKSLRIEEDVAIYLTRQDFFCLSSNNSRGHLVDFKRLTERIVYKFESEKSKSVKSHHMAAALIRGKTVVVSDRTSD